MLSLLSFIYIFGVTFVEIPKENQRFADIILGSLLSMVIGGIISHYFNDGNNDNPSEEILSGKAEAWKRQQSWQFTKLFQLNSPDVLFDSGLGFSLGLKFRIKGLVQNTKNDIHAFSFLLS